jgi:hypothetical protein
MMMKRAGDYGKPRPHPPSGLSLTPGFSGIGFMIQVMRGYGVPFTVVPVSPSVSLNLTELLWTSDSSARFAGYVM